MHLFFAMLTNKQIKRIKSLSIKKYRERYGEFIAEGDKIIKDLIVAKYQLVEIYATASWLEKNKNILPRNCKTFAVCTKELKSISQQTTPNQVLSIIKIPEIKDPPEAYNKITLVTDNLQDPGNLGAILRTADWFGIKNIICSKNTVDLYNPKVIQSTMGSFCRLQICYTSINDYLQKHNKKIPVYGSFLIGENAFQHNFAKEAILVVGNESKGISPAIEKFITHKITIPPYFNQNGNKADSLNASVATAILMALIRMEDC